MDMYVIDGFYLLDGTLLPVRMVLGFNKIARALERNLSTVGPLDNLPLLTR